MLTTATLGRSNYNPEMTSAHVRPAGVTTVLNESAKDALSWGERPQTPPEQKKYRQSTIHEPGKIVKHYGTAEDPVPNGPFGDKTRSQPGETVADYIKSYPDSEIARWKLDRAEDIYASSKKEPLGQGYVRGHKIPEGLGTERPFGKVINAKEKDKTGQVRTVIFPTDVPPEEIDEMTHQMHLISHGAYSPGEQRRRNYNWDAPGIDPTIHRFGAVDKDDYRDGVRKALQPELDPAQPHPKVSSKLHEDFRLTATDHLGKPRNLGAGERNLPSDHTFGMPSLRKGREAGVDELLKGSYSLEEQAPDADLGKSLREGYRNLQPDNRVFGVPSVRTDLSLPRQRSVANTQNYGNEPDAQQLLRPPMSVERGVCEEHYLQMRPREEVRSLVEEAGIPLDPQQFDAVFDMAAEADGEPGAAGRCCLDTFFKARHHVLAMQMMGRGLV